MKKRFTAGAMLIVVLALFVFSVASAVILYYRQVDAARQSLQELLSLADAQGEVTDVPGLVASFEAAAPDKRLTIIAADGSVLADTGSDTVENHADRPEVREAMAAGWGEITRSSDTVGYSMLYVAKRFSDGTVGRAAMPLSSIFALVWGSIPAILAVAILALSLTYGVAKPVAKRLTRPLEAVGEDLMAVLNGGEPAALETYQADEELRPILSYIRQMVGYFKGHLEQIKSERDKVALILDCMDEGLILLDDGGDILAINRAARELLQLPESGNGGALVQLRAQRFSKAMEVAHQTHTPAVVDLNDPSLGDRELRFFLSPVEGRQYEGQTVGTSVLISDVTELKKAENIRSEFTANVSHELKTPLTSIRGSCELLSKGMVKPEDQPRFFTLISVEVERLISLINDILELSELESVVIDQPSETVSALEIAREVQTMLLPEAEEKGIAVVVRGDSGNLRIAPAKLKELLLNLMENAVRYGEKEGGVEVTVSEGHGQVIIAVADNGIGIPEEAQPHVFERFYRVDKSRSRQSGGTGLGLAIVKHIAELYGGSVGLQSTLGEGSTFTVTLQMEV